MKKIIKLCFHNKLLNMLICIVLVSGFCLQSTSASNIAKFFDKEFVLEYILIASDRESPAVPPNIQFEVDIESVPLEELAQQQTQNVLSFYSYFMNVDRASNPSVDIQIIVREDAFKKVLNGEIVVFDNKAASTKDINTQCYYEVESFFRTKARIIIDIESDILNCLHQSVLKALGINMSSYIYLATSGQFFEQQNLSVFRVLDVLAAIVRNTCLSNFPKSQFDQCIREQIGYE